MKCIKSVPVATKMPDGTTQNFGNENEVLRVSNEKAERMVKTGLYSFCSKADWKAAGRHYS